jgi:hypothetical protein
MENPLASFRILKSEHLKQRYSALVAILAIASLSISCSNARNAIESQIDKSKGQWIQKSDNLYQYRISNKAKDIILNEYQNDNEKWRANKETVALFYINDIDPQFSVIKNT